MAKIWLVIHHPFRNATNGERLSQETRDRTFLTSIDVIRYSRMLETQQKTSRWGWLFRTYFQWHAVAFLLSELCVRPYGTAVEEAWEVIDEAFPDWDQKGHSHRRSILWKPIAKLIVKARTVRVAELAKRNAFPADGMLGPVYDSKGAVASASSTAPSSAGRGGEGGGGGGDSSTTASSARTPSSSVAGGAGMPVPEHPCDSFAGGNGSENNPFELSLDTKNSNGNNNINATTGFNSATTAPLSASATSLDPASISMFDFDATMADGSGMGMWFDDPTLGQDSNWEFNNILPWGNFTEGGPDGVGPPGGAGWDGSAGTGMSPGMSMGLGMGMDSAMGLSGSGGGGGMSDTRVGAMNGGLNGSNSGIGNLGVMGGLSIGDGLGMVTGGGGGGAGGVSAGQGMEGIEGCSHEQIKGSGSGR